MIDTIVNACFEDALPKIAPDTIALTVTSPPYGSLRDGAYNSSIDVFLLAQELLRVTRDAGVCVWVVNDETLSGRRTCESMKEALEFVRAGWGLFDEMVYEKTGTSYPSSGRYLNIWEHMYVFVKGSGKPIFHAICDQPKLWEGSWGKTSRRNRDGSLTESTSDSCGKARSGRATDGRYGYKARTNIWLIKNGKKFGHSDEYAYKHPATFPEALAEGHILTWTDPDDIVLDPMCGSGTTCKMAVKNDRHFIGIDCDGEYCQVARKRVALLTHGGL